MGRTFKQKLLKDLKLTFMIGSLLGLAVFTLVRTILYEVPFSLQEDGGNLLRVILTGWILVMILRLFLYVLFFMADKVETISIRKLFVQISPLPLYVMIIGFFVLISCNIPPSGITKELDTGLVTTYKGLKPERTRVEMNGETLTHNDIPIGESFRIINEGISGLKVEDGVVSVACKLEIRDKHGKILLSEPDLFKGRNIFKKDSATLLSCTVNTGQPMEWEEKYEVKAVFTDNFGKGTIENVITIRAIDVP